MRSKIQNTSACGFNVGCCQCDFKRCIYWIFKLINWHAEHMALALASSGSALVNAGLLYFYLHKRNIFRFGAHWKNWHFNMAWPTLR